MMMREQQKGEEYCYSLPHGLRDRGMTMISRWWK